MRLGSARRQSLRGKILIGKRFWEWHDFTRAALPQQRSRLYPHYGAGICTLDAIFEYPLSWLLELTAVAA
jgi:hypothetical protein